MGARFRVSHYCGFVLAAVAVPAGQAKIVPYIVASGIDMIDLHRLPAVFFTGLAVFAAATSAFIDELLQGVPGQFTHATA
jgi:hypothetical protein